ncbi:DUF4190 domain-containing protein [Cellulomonas bogoriensis]|uniref:Integral membrane protein n=1 Tax=Cellulomonas bogoriensis 69B4 = DSM 16987 TaxID=1386082 RepID=A0A0A0C2X8_9CELL|nr:DUF4190 domain-containing protein [Cellulomonas bogoriensis]KGM14347.1 integral membrane protein [Cellulomonas bogoriensis 69B4 = DSM 16987]
MSNPTGPQDPYGAQPPQGGGYGAQPPGGGYGAPPPPPGYGSVPGGSTEKNSLGVWALILGILGLVCCGIFTAIPAIIVGQKSKQAAAEGLANNGGLGSAGVILGWIGIALTVLGAIWAFAMGGLAVLGDPTIWDTTGY